MGDDEYTARSKKDAEQIPGYTFENRLPPGIAAVSKQFQSAVPNGTFDKIFHQWNLEMVVI
jgi:hypothetical protein